MHIDRGSFLMLVSTLSIGAVGGYVSAEKRLFPAIDKWRGRAPEPTAPPVAPEPPKPVAAVETADAAPPPPPAPAAPACDDTTGSPGDCPPPGFPTFEGGCGSFAHTRCNEFKQAFKPKVAQAAVECLTKLTAAQRCDPVRVNLCGHLALTNACPEPESANGADAGSSVVVSTCQAIAQKCGASPIAPSPVECKQLLAGMTEKGRERTSACMKTHCFDRGLVGCEGVAAPR
ncbi:MAG: hypothetical protein KF819_00775 [Labilithrix sp.]|nr:hypothetical protein [Labilithrix sp.]